MTPPPAEKVAEPQMQAEAAIAWLTEAAKYFERRNDGGEDAAFWANVYNAENCRKIATLLTAAPAPSVAQSERDLGPDGKEWAKTKAGYAHVETMMPRADDPQNIMWHGWALREAFVTGAEWQEARASAGSTMMDANKLANRLRNEADLMAVAPQRIPDRTLDILHEASNFIAACTNSAPPALTDSERDLAVKTLNLIEGLLCPPKSEYETNKAREFAIGLRRKLSGLTS